MVSASTGDREKRDESTRVSGRRIREFPRASKIDVRRRTLAISVLIHRLAIICEQSCDRSAAVPPRQRDTSTSKEDWERDPHPSPSPLHCILLAYLLLQTMDVYKNWLRYWRYCSSAGMTIFGRPWYRKTKKNNAWSLRSSFLHGLQHTNKSSYFEVMDLIFRKNF